MHILLLEDDPRIAGLLERGLGEEGHRVYTCADLASARQAAAEGGFDLMVVDRMLPDGDGLSLVRERRRAGDDTPAICLSARDRLEERVEGLYGGADDYIVKPFSFEELLARVVAAGRRRGRAPGERIEVGDLVIDLPARRVFRGGEEVLLTTREFDLLRFLAERRGRVQSRTRILEGVWDITHDPGTNVVEVYISYLRSKIDKDAERPLIHTVRGVGYVLDPDRR